MTARWRFTLALLVCGGGACSASAANRPDRADTDNDGIPNSVDQCPNEAEDYDGHLDGDGCPDVDDSGHLILDEDDRCPIVLDCEEAFIDYDGCPDVILDFALHSASLTAKHLETVGELADEIETRKKIKRLRIDGHFAADEAELLATQRSELVRQRLVARGIPAAMLEIRAGKAPDGSRGFVSFFALECAP